MATKPYLANTQNASGNTMNALMDVAGQLGISGAGGMNSYDLTTAIKQAYGGSGNTYGGTIGNATLKNFGYQVDKAGNISKIETPPAGAVGSGVTTLPGLDGQVFDAAAITPAIYQQAVLNEQLRQQQQQIMEQMQAQYASQQAAIQNQTQATVDSINANRAGIDDAYQEAQRQAYINSVLQQNQMGDYLAASGYSGGMAESTLAQINNNYATNRRQATSERDAANLEIDKMVAQARASGDASLADAANNYYSNYLAALENQQQLDYQLNSDLMGQINAEAERQAQAAQLQYERNQYNREYSDAQSRESAAQDFETFLNTYQKKHANKSTYDQWIKNLQAMNDPYSYNAQKIDYLQQYVNKTFGSGASSGSTEEDSEGGGGTSANYDYVKRTASSRLNGRDVDGRTAGAEAVINYINKSNLLTETEKEQMARELGLL